MKYIDPAGELLLRLLHGRKTTIILESDKVFLRNPQESSSQSRPYTAMLELHVDIGIGMCDGLSYQQSILHLSMGLDCPLYHLSSTKMRQMCGTKLSWLVTNDCPSFDTGFSRTDYFAQHNETHRPPTTWVRMEERS